jgi:hypothetical protein
LRIGKEALQDAKGHRAFKRIHVVRMPPLYLLGYTRSTPALVGEGQRSASNCYVGTGTKPFGCNLILFLWDEAYELWNQRNTDIHEPDERRDHIQ